MQKALLIAEKPSERRIIEDVYNKHRSEIPYTITFLEQRGHLMTLKYPGELDEEQKNWCWENLPFHPEEHGGWQYKIIEEAKKGSFLTSKERFYQIKDELDSGDYDFVINAGDADQEGELLIRIVLSALKCSLPIKRYWSNETTEDKVLNALVNLLDDDKDPMLVNLLKAAYGRQHSDYRFGMNITRAASLKMGVMAACGRVKTPILSIVCKREDEIAHFKPSTCYGISADYTDGFSGQMFADKGEAGEDKDEDESQKGLIWFDTKEEAEEFIGKLGKRATVVACEKKKVESYAPKLFKLATAQIAAGKLGLNSAQTLSVIQSLYEKGFLSYPRTDCEYVSSEENFGAMLKAAASVPLLKPYVDSIDPAVIGKVKATKKWVNDAKLKDSGHSALVPTTKAPNFDELSNEEKAIYALVCRQFIAIFLPPLVQEKTQLITEIDGNTFRSTGKTLIDAGYTKIFGTKFSDTEVPYHSAGDVLTVNMFTLISKTTTCPKRFTDADLIAVCEAPHKYLDDVSLKALGDRLKIGTPATRASIIKELIDHNKYLKRSKEGKKEYIVPTEVGRDIYNNLKDLDICKVDLTAMWEEKLEKVRRGEMSLDELEQGMKCHVNELVENIRENSDITKVFSAKKVVCKCPECDGDIIAGSKGFYCSNYKEGCEVGAFNKVCDTTIKSEDFAKMIAGQSVRVRIAKGDKKWDQDLRYDSEAHKIVFVERTDTETSFKCPNCSAPIISDGRKMKCKSECGFELWVNTLGKTLSESQIERFFNEGTTGMIKGLKGKSGKPFDAEIVLKDDKTGTELKFKPKKEK